MGDGMPDGVSPEVSGSTQRLEAIMLELASQVSTLTNAQKQTVAELKIMNSQVKYQEKTTKATETRRKSFEESLLDGFTKDQRTILSRYEKQIKEISRDISHVDRALDALKHNSREMKKFQEWAQSPEERKKYRGERQENSREYNAKLNKFQDDHFGESLRDYFLKKSPLMQKLTKTYVRGPGSDAQDRIDKRSSFKKTHQQIEDLGIKKQQVRYMMGEDDADQYKYDVENNQDNRYHNARRAAYFRKNNRREQGAREYEDRQKARRRTKGQAEVNPNSRLLGLPEGIEQTYLPYPTESQVEKKFANDYKQPINMSSLHREEPTSKPAPSDSDLIKLPGKYGLPALYLGQILKREFKTLEEGQKEIANATSLSGVKGLLDGGLGLEGGIAGILKGLVPALVSAFPAILTGLVAAGAIALVVSAIAKDTKERQDKTNAIIDDIKNDPKKMAALKAKGVDINGLQNYEEVQAAEAMSSGKAVDPNLLTGTKASNTLSKPNMGAAIGQHDAGLAAAGDFTAASYLWGKDSVNGYYYIDDKGKKIFVNPTADQKTTLFNRWQSHEEARNWVSLQMALKRGKGRGDISSFDDVFNVMKDPTVKNSDLLKFHTGGVVPGKRGDDVPIIAKAGEHVTPPGQSEKLNEDSKAVATNTQDMVAKLTEMIQIQNQLLEEMRRNTQVTEKSGESTTSPLPKASKQFVNMTQ